MTAPASPLVGLTTAEVCTLLQAFARFPGIERVVLFGSRAKGTHRPASDVDLAIIGPVTRAELAQLALALDDTTLPYHLDLVLVRTIDNPALLAHIEQVGQTIYDRATPPQ